MKIKLIALMILLCCISSYGEIGTDKLAHIGISYAIQDFSYAMWYYVDKDDKENALLKAVLTTLLLGISKEMIDAHTPGKRFDHMDLAADMVGIGLSVGTTLVFRW